MERLSLRPTRTDLSISSPGILFSISCASSRLASKEASTSISSESEMTITSPLEPAPTTGITLSIFISTGTAGCPESVTNTGLETTISPRGSTFNPPDPGISGNTMQLKGAGLGLVTST
ncbi:hypothetical protein DPMN_043849 [Dreissena polymorpha]|uniref:Uncharacterized protein n=1 Tax=Dreissena polymorpha TaxID=45954 RepID=A0A9D4D189_DREPO|nr:hypothetical protein DPMN_043849 [Dreissena polymorpha]